MMKSQPAGRQTRLAMSRVDTGAPKAAAWPNAGTDETTGESRRRPYGDLSPSDAKRLKQLEEEYAKLKRIVADLD